MRINFRELHRWIGLYVVILTLIWVTEAIALPPLFSSGLPTIDNTLPTLEVSANTASLSLEDAMQAFLAQHSDGVRSSEIDAITYFPTVNVYRFENQTQYFDWYINAQNGELLKYGFNASQFLEQQGFLRWLHPWIGKLIQFSSFLLTLMLVASGFWLFIKPYLAQKAHKT